MAEEVFKYVQIGGEEYRIEKFAPVPGLQLARLTLAKLTPVAEKLTGGGEEILTALCAAVSSLTDEEVEALVTKCLRFCCKKKKLGWAACVDAAGNYGVAELAHDPVTALALSALPAGRFCFEGFLSTSKKSREEHLESLRGEGRTMIFYEAPHKLQKTLADLAAAFGGERRISLCRELTKLHEEVVRTTLAEAVTLYADEPPRGEFVLVVEGAPEQTEELPTADAALERVKFYRSEGRSLKEAAKLAAADTGYSKNELYELALKSKD